MGGGLAAPAALCSAAAATAAAAGFLDGDGGTRTSISGLGLVTPPTSLAVDAPIPETETLEIEFKLEFEPVILRLRSFGCNLSWPVTFRLRSFDCNCWAGLV